MKKTLEQLLEIDNIVGNLYDKNPKLRDGKFGYAYNRFYVKNIKPILDDMQEKIVDVRIENAMVDEKTKELLREAEENSKIKNYKYTKEGMKKLTKDIREIVKESNAIEVEVIPFITSDVPEMLDEQKEMLKGLIIE